MMSRLFKRVAAVALAAVLMATQSSAATFNPFGPQNDVAKSTVTDGGWTQVYQGFFGSRVAYNTAFNSLEDWVMIASARVGSNTFDLLASIRVSDFNALPTARNATRDHNGAAWYRTGASLGFAPEGASITQSSADTTDRSSRQRMSWHTSGGYSAAPTSINGGWRSGPNTNLNNSTSWERFIFTASDADLRNGVDPNPVPVPASLPLLAVGVAGFAWLKRRKSA